MKASATLLAAAAIFYQGAAALPAAGWTGTAVIPAKVVERADAAPSAFPGAEGFGRNAIGGRTGTVYKVTNLK